MKKIVLLAMSVAIICVAFTASAQNMGGKRMKASPADTVKGNVKGGVNVEVDYSRPFLKGRPMGTELAPYGKVWRVGADEATTITFSKDVKIDGKMLPAGKYGFYAIPGEKEWVLIFNSVWKIWGLNYTRNEAEGMKTDVLRVTVKPETVSASTEELKFFIDPAGSVYFMWGNVKVGFKVK